MEVYIPTHISLAIGEAMLRSIVKDLEAIEKGKAILGKFGVSMIEKSEDMESVTLNSLLNDILPQEDLEDDSEEDEYSDDDSEHSD
jgi:ATP-dependent RNA circularization protein (DNA/RNA ligase family)